MKCHINVNSIHFLALGGVAVYKEIDWHPPTSHLL